MCDRARQGEMTTSNPPPQCTSTSSTGTSHTDMVTDILDGNEPTVCTMADSETAGPDVISPSLALGSPVSAASLDLSSHLSSPASNTSVDLLTTPTPVYYTPSATLSDRSKRLLSRNATRYAYTKNIQWMLYIPINTWSSFRCVWCELISCDVLMIQLIYQYFTQSVGGTSLCFALLYFVFTSINAIFSEYHRWRKSVWWLYPQREL